MAGLGYLLPRFIRHILPEPAVRFLLGCGWIIRPGLATRAPLEAVERYLKAAVAAGGSIVGKRVLILGYGGNFTTACELLRHGADHVVLAEKEGFPDRSSNAALLPIYPDYLMMEGGQVLPYPEKITLCHSDIRQDAVANRLESVDFVFSNSVYEHLEDVEGITRALAALSNPDVIQVHFIDLRDHYFKYPFEMLCYSEETWLRWLNPSSHHNRYRLHDYERTFRACFKRVEITILASDYEAFSRERSRIRPEFLSGHDPADAATLILVSAVGQKRRPEQDLLSCRCSEGIDGF